MTPTTLALQMPIQSKEESISSLHPAPDAPRAPRPTSPVDRRAARRSARELLDRMNKVAARFSALGIGMALCATHVGAACLDPRDPTLKADYHPSLEDEVKTSSAIVVATVLDVQALSEDPSDPNGWTSFIYKVRIEEALLGNVPSEILLGAPNDSGGYRMSRGEKHLLFLKRSGDPFSADVCGNSTVLPKGSEVLEQLTAHLAGARHAV